MKVKHKNIYVKFSSTEGIENSDKVALNLTLKEDSKRIWFGNFYGGYNILLDNKFEYKGNLMNFGKNNYQQFLFSKNCNQKPYLYVALAGHRICKSSIV